MPTSEETGDEGVRITETDTRAGWEPRKTGYTAEQAAADRAAREETEAMGEREHMLSICSSFLRPGQWVVCSCGWASPDVQFPNDAEAIAWARKEHSLDA